MLLDVSEACLKQAISDLNLRTTILRKERAVGMIPGGEYEANSVHEGVRACTSVHEGVRVKTKQCTCGDVVPL